MSRTKNSIRNAKYSIFSQLIVILISFLARMVFVHALSAEYLGLNGLFTNIISMLSFAELGIGTSIVFSLYRPLAEKNESKINALMNLYKKAYMVIGLVVGVLGLLLTPFLGYFISDLPDIPNIKLIYLMFVLNSVLSYFFSYRRSLIIADQKSYINSIFQSSSDLILNISQMIVLVLTHNYILYLSLKIISTIVLNISISLIVIKLYPYLNHKSKDKLEDEEKKSIVRNVKALSWHKIGGIVVFGTDSLLLSKFINVVAVGIYSNYLLIINALNLLFGLVFQSITASVGNLGTTESKEKNIFIFNCIDLICFWIYAIASISLINLFNPFIRLWLGEEYLFPTSTVVIIVINFYLSGRRKSVMTFKDAFGLFWNDRYKPIFEALIKLISSIILVKFFGVKGIFIGTAISTITTCFWIEPYILFKHGFKSSVQSYFNKYIWYAILAIFISVLTGFVCSIFSDTSFVGFVIRMIVCATIPNLLLLLIFWRTKEFEYLKKSLIKQFRYNKKGNINV